MNKKDKYFGDTRYEKVWEQMKLLNIEDITTDRQHKNGTIVWKLPIKCQYTGILIEVASFASGYVRNQGKSCHSNYQLNKRCEGEPEYFELPNGDYRRFSTRSCVLIPIEIDRLEYLISYCLKNYYIKNANSVAEGKFIPKWKYEWELKRGGHYDRIKELEKDLDDMTQERDCARLHEVERNDDRIKDLENKLDTIKRISDYE